MVISKITVGMIWLLCTVYTIIKSVDANTKVIKKDKLQYFGVVNSTIFIKFNGRLLSIEFIDLRDEKTSIEVSDNVENMKYKMNNQAIKLNNIDGEDNIGKRKISKMMSIISKSRNDSLRNVFYLDGIIIILFITLMIFFALYHFNEKRAVLNNFKKISSVSI
uniref:GOLD domain-containing protein n=1 Tax=Strongyloides venezuelensis TaxID=75913 RepID=A0A0K0F9C2_STRVS